MIGIGSFLQLEKQECRSNVCFQFMVFPIPKSVAELSFFGEQLQLHEREERNNHSSSLSSSANQAEPTIPAQPVSYQQSLPSDRSLLNASAKESGTARDASKKNREQRGTFSLNRHRLAPSQLLAYSLQSPPSLYLFYIRGVPLFQFQST